MEWSAGKVKYEGIKFDVIIMERINHFVMMITYFLKELSPLRQTQLKLPASNQLLSTVPICDLLLIGSKVFIFIHLLE